jgi:dihydrofolate synthase/folylpolyglutamate synthase
MRRASESGAVLLRAGQDFDFEIHDSGFWTWRGPTKVIEGLCPPGLIGEFQTSNAAAVLMLLEAAGLSDAVDKDLINDALPKVSLAGRLQRLTGDAGLSGKEWLVDVAHNPAAAGVLSTTLAMTPCIGETIAIVGLLEDKDVEGVIDPLLSEVDRWIAMTPDSHRAIAANELARQIANLAGRACLVAESTSAAIDFARREASEDDRILVTGSFFTVGPVLETLTTLSRTKS